MKKGDRVELIRCNDPYTRLEAGERGTVALVDDLGTIHVKWDSGSSLGLCREDGDAWRVLDELQERADEIYRARYQLPSGEQARENPHATLLKKTQAELDATVEAFTENGS